MHQYKTGFELPTSFRVWKCVVSKRTFCPESVNGKMAIYLGYSDLSGFIVESCRQNMDNKVTL